MMRRFSYALFLVLAVVGLVGFGAVLYARSAEPDFSGSHPVAGLTAPVEVWRDSLGVPHIWAATDADLFRALGFVHAQDRLFQMEMFRRVADGRLAEIIGPSMLESDRFLRTVGLGRAAAENERRLGAEERGLLEAYAAGVNAWIGGNRRALPPEFIALRFRPEPWTVRHSLSIGKIMAWDLADWHGPLNLQRAVDRVGSELAEALRPPYPEWGPRILADDASWNAGSAGIAVATNPPTPMAELGIPLPRIPHAARPLIDGVSAARASNSWVIGGELTRSGKPILANDMHLALRAPSLWYLAALHGGSFEVAGMTLPGAPGVVAGHSRRVAWGFTNAMVADVDFFVERVDSTDPARYLTPEGWRRFEIRAETIQVKGRDPVVHTVRVGRNGPVLSDVDGRAGGRVVAMRWTALEPTAEIVALLAMNRARDAHQFLQAARRFDNPHQNVVFADADGWYGYRLVGRVPVRRGGDGRLPVPGWTGEYDWVRYLEPDEHPEVLRGPGHAPRGAAPPYIVTANNKLLRAGDDPAGAMPAAGRQAFPFQIGRDWAEPFRAKRIEQLIREGREFTADDVLRQQTDLHDAFARRYLPHAVRAAEAAGEDAAVRTLRSWNAEARPDSHGAALFYTWYELLRYRIGADEYRGDPMYFPRAALNRILDDGGGAWVNDVRTQRRETLDEQASAAMREAVRRVGGRSWGELHETSITHALGSAGALDRILGINIPSFARGGSPYTVDVAGYGNRAPFVNRHGASQRHVVDLADVDGAGGFVIPTGQSGLPFSRHYRDQTPIWRGGGLWLIPLDRARAEARAVHRMILDP